MGQGFFGLRRFFDAEDRAAFEQVQEFAEHGRGGKGVFHDPSLRIARGRWVSPALDPPYAATRYAPWRVSLLSPAKCFRTKMRSAEERLVLRSSCGP